jgi:D-serine deaminase-like pyridoxal phosphate-dependent protein
MAWRAILRDHPLPAAVVDLDAVDRNVDRVVAAIGDHDVTLRLATKSVRHVGLIRRILERGGPRFRGLMTYAAGEAALLAEEGLDDLLLAYPIGRRSDAEQVAEAIARGVTLRCVVDDPAQVALLSEAAASRGVVVPLCIDVDASWRPGGLHLGVRRSPIRTPEQAVALARVIAEGAAVVLVGIMAYEAQVAGIRDHSPGGALTDPVKRWIKARSRPVVARRRADVIAALSAQGHAVALVNGGGTGSLSSTAADPSVTEVTAGSAFLCPHLFDGYDGLPLEPAAFFALPVVRSSDPGWVTCAGGGYPASGPSGGDRLPVVALPDGLEPSPLEGFGEVQTPLRWTGQSHGSPPAIGDPILCRHAKAGELAERFASILLVRGGEAIGSEPTYRGMGACFP